MAFWAKPKRSSNKSSLTFKSLWCRIEWKNCFFLVIYKQRLSISHSLCQTINSANGIPPLSIPTVTHILLTAEQIGCISAVLYQSFFIWIKQSDKTFANLFEGCNDLWTRLWWNGGIHATLCYSHLNHSTSGGNVPVWGRECGSTGGYRRVC